MKLMKVDLGSRNPKQWAEQLQKEPYCGKLQSQVIILFEFVTINDLIHISHFTFMIRSIVKIKIWICEALRLNLIRISSASRTDLTWYFFLRWLLYVQRIKNIILVYTYFCSLMPLLNKPIQLLFDVILWFPKTKNCNCVKALNIWMLTFT